MFKVYYCPDSNQTSPKLFVIFRDSKRCPPSQSLHSPQRHLPINCQLTSIHQVIHLARSTPSDVISPKRPKSRSTGQDILGLRKIANALAEHTKPGNGLRRVSMPYLEVKPLNLSVLQFSLTVRCTPSSKPVGDSCCPSGNRSRDACRGNNKRAVSFQNPRVKKRDTSAQKMHGSGHGLKHCGREKLAPTIRPSNR